MKNKAKVNYGIDMVIALAFILSAVSGLVLFFAPHSGGYMGGRNATYTANILFVAKDTWKVVHNWSSIAMIAGVLGHLVLHWNWMVCMTKNIFKKMRTPKVKIETCPVDA